MTQVQKPSEILRAARELISVPERWTREWYARDASGRWVDFDSAVCFCSMGALARASGCVDGFELDEEGPAVLFLEKAIDHDNIPAWNDDLDRTHGEIIAAFDAAIALAEKAEVES